MSVIRFLSTSSPKFLEQLQELTEWESALDMGLEAQVRSIIQAVRSQGDVGVLAYTARFDLVHAESVSDLEVERADMEKAFLSLPQEMKDALNLAADRIRVFHEHQKVTSWSFTDQYQSTLGQRISPLDKVGIYVPGGKAAYPSSVLMNAIPAKVAGVPEVVMVSPSPKDVMNPVVLAAAWIAGVDRVFRIGGAQAVAALAYGTETVPSVDKIVGPGNAYVAMAKRLVFGQVGIDLIAGPSEIVIVSDASTPVDWLVLDLFSQAEHDELAQVILLSSDANHLKEVEACIRRLLPNQPRRDIIEKSLKNRGILIHTSSLDEAFDLVNQIAPEHLELSILNADRYVDRVKHAGAIFVGAYTSESLGDYCAGANHVLPTGRGARFASALGVYDFQKRTTILQVSQSGADVLGRVAETLALGEGLYAHAQSAAARTKFRS
jgi:histidinol dehydrogenase